MAQAPLLTLIFHGSFGACREDEQDWTIPSQQGSLDDFPLKRSQAYRSILVDAERRHRRPGQPRA
jgi:hypothetical protein